MKKRKVIPRPKRTQFNCMVDAELLAKANAARMTTWVVLVEGMMQDLLDDRRKKK